MVRNSGGFGEGGLLCCCLGGEFSFYLVSVGVVLSEIFWAASAARGLFAVGKMKVTDSFKHCYTTDPLRLSVYLWSYKLEGNLCFFS